MGDPQDLSDHPLLLDIFSLGTPQLRIGLGFLFSFKVSFEKHPTVHSVDIMQTRKEHVCRLRIDLVMHLFTERGVEHSVLSELLFEAHLGNKLMEG